MRSSAGGERREEHRSYPAFAQPRLSYDIPIIFVARVFAPFDTWTIDVDGKPLGRRHARRQGRSRASEVRLQRPRASRFCVKVGLSAVSVEGAKKKTWPPKSPLGISRERSPPAAKSWSDVLGRIEIETSDPALRETFYSALYHSCIAPTLFNDADGRYFGLDHKVHGPDGFQNYCTFSLWTPSAPNTRC